MPVQLNDIKNAAIAYANMLELALAEPSICMESLQYKAKRDNLLQELDNLELNGWFVQRRLRGFIERQLKIEKLKSEIGLRPNLLSKEEAARIKDKIERLVQIAAEKQAPKTWFEALIQRPLYNLVLFITTPLAFIFGREMTDVYAERYKLAIGNYIQAYRAPRPSNTTGPVLKSILQGHIKQALAEGITKEQMLEAIAQDNDIPSHTKGIASKKIVKYADQCAIHLGYFALFNHYASSAARLMSSIPTTVCEHLPTIRSTTRNRQS